MKDFKVELRLKSTNKKAIDKQYKMIDDFINDLIDNNILQDEFLEDFKWFDKLIEHRFNDALNTLHYDMIRRDYILSVYIDKNDIDSKILENHSIKIDDLDDFIEYDYTMDCITLSDWNYKSFDDLCLDYNKIILYGVLK